jgi:hypothetical protein
MSPAGEFKTQKILAYTGFYDSYKQNYTIRICFLTFKRAQKIGQMVRTDLIKKFRNNYSLFCKLDRSSELGK